MAELVAGALLSGVFNVLLDRLASREVLNFLRGQKNDGGRRNVGILDELKFKLLVLQPVLDDAESKQFTKPAVREWLDELKHVVYQAEDLLDQINYQVLRCKVEAEYQNDRNDQMFCLLLHRLLGSWCWFLLLNARLLSFLFYLLSEQVKAGRLVLGPLGFWFPADGIGDSSTSIAASVVLPFTDAGLLLF